MSKYRSTGQLDDPQIIDGDTHFVGLDQTTPPDQLMEGQYQVGENIRLENGKIMPRGGIKKINPLSLGNSSFPSKPLELLNYQNPRTALRLKMSFDAPRISEFFPKNFIVNMKLVAKSGGQIVWNHESQTNFTGDGIPVSTFPVEVSSLTIDYDVNNFSHLLFDVHPDLEFHAYAVSYEIQATRDEVLQIMEGGTDLTYFSPYSPSQGESYSGRIYFDDLESWKVNGVPHSHKFEVVNSNITSRDENQSNRNEQYNQLTQLQTRYDEYKVFEHHNFKANLSTDPLSDSRYERNFNFLPDGWRIDHWVKRRVSPSYHEIYVYRDDVFQKSFHVSTNDMRDTPNSALVARFVEVFTYIRDRYNEDNGRVVLTANTSNPEGGFPLIDIETQAIQDEDLMVIFQDSMVGLFTEQNAIFTSEYSKESEVTALQAFNKAIIFSRGYKPKVWGGDNANVYELGNTAKESNSDGSFFVCPNAPFGNYIANRLVVPYYEDSQTSVAISDIFDENNYFSRNVFPANRGTSDITLAFSVFAENQLLVFNRNSIHLINNLHAVNPYEDSEIFEITRQYGIAGSKALAQNGSYYYFISSEGNIQVLVPSSDPAKGLGIAISKVTLDQLPLSKPIQDTVDKIDRKSLPYSIAHYHRNKVYFAFGIDAPYPNTIAVYDSLRSTWVSIDTFGRDVRIKSIKSLKNRIFMILNDSVVEYEVGNEDFIEPYYTQITSKFKSRDYRLGSHSVKKFTRGSLSLTHDRDTKFITNINATDPNTRIETQNFKTETNESKISRFNISARGYSVNVEVDAYSLSQNPDELDQWQLKNISVEGYNTSRVTGNYS